MNCFASANNLLLFIILRSACLSKSLCKGIMINLQLCNLFILISRHANELGLFEDIGPEGGVRQLKDVVGPDQVKSWLIFVHRVQYRQSVLIRYVVGEFEFVERNHFLHPLLPGGRTIRMNVHSLGHFWVSLSRNNPPAVVELVSEVICSYDIKEEDVFSLRVQTRELEFHLREHLPSSFGDDHLCAAFVELIPEILLFESHFRIILYIVFFWHRHSWRHASEGEPG